MLNKEYSGYRAVVNKGIKIRLGDEIVVSKDYLALEEVMLDGDGGLTSIGVQPQSRSPSNRA